MLIDFTVENFRSIKDPVTLSMVAAPTKKSPSKATSRRNIKPDDEIAPPFRLESRNLELLPALGIFGANASGKSNVLRAFDYFLFIAWRGALPKENFLNWFVPFRLCNKEGTPTRFELRTVQNDTIFTYMLALNSTRILREKLEHIPPPPRRMQNRLLFDRVWHEESQAYIVTNGKDFGDAYREIEQSLRVHEPFLSLLTTRLNVEIVKPFVSLLNTRLTKITPGHEQFDFDFAARFLKTSFPSMLTSVTQIVRRFDTGIDQIEIESVNPERAEEDERFRVWVWHDRGDGQRVRWLMQEESTGTQRLFSLAFAILFAFAQGTPLIIDELGSNIHPNITRAIVRMFQSVETNPKRAQLIFTSHDNTLQRGNLLRRDQIWFTQKRSDGSTELYPLSDFKPRNDLAIDKAYLEGRFGAVPILPDEEELLEPAEAK